MTKKDLKSRIYDDPLWKKALKKPSYARKKITRKFQHVFQDQRRFLTQKPEQWGIVNQAEVRMVGLRRSGNHALISWMKNQQDGKFKHINDVPLEENPYRHEYEYFLDHYPQYPKEIERLRQFSNGNFKKKDWLLYNYEDHRLDKISSPAFARKRDWYVGPSARRIDLIIMRDPFNLLASRIKKGFTSVKSSQVSFTDLWIAYAREYLNETNFLTETKVCISYNRWIQDVEYRRLLAEQLGLPFTDDGFTKVARRAGGSSFDGTTHDGDAAKMDLTGRWRHYLNDELYQTLLKNKTLISYTERIFGDVSGLTEVQSALGQL